MRLRFGTGHEVLDSFASARADIGPDLADAEPLAYLDGLAQAGRPEAALSFCAYLLPRREAVWWGCRGLKTLPSRLPPADAVAALAAAERWVERPDDAGRRAALALAMAGDLAQPEAWMAVAAGWAGGSMALGAYAVPVQPHLTARAVRAGLLLGLAALPGAGRREALDGLLGLGRRMVAGAEVL